MENTNLPERYLSEALQSLPGIAHHTAPLRGVEAEMYNRLWRLIIEGKLKIGLKLREDILGESFGVSRTVVRKVLIIMEQEGIVSLPVNYGAFVATPTPEEARNVIEVGKLITVHVVSGMAAENFNISSDNLERIERHIKLQNQAESEGDFVKSRLLSGEFQLLLVHIYGNKILATQFENIITRLLMVEVAYQQYKIFEPKTKFQEKLFACIRNHDAKAVSDAIASYWDDVDRYLHFDEAAEEMDLRSLLSDSLDSPSLKKKKNKKV